MVKVGIHFRILFEGEWIRYRSYDYKPNGYATVDIAVTFAKLILQDFDSRHGIEVMVDGKWSPINLENVRHL